MYQVKEVLDFLLSYQHLGSKKTEHGAMLVGKAPHIAPQAWLHHIYPPLQEAQLAGLETALGLSFPKEYADFLFITNGLNVFSDTLALYGIRNNMVRTAEANQEQPYDIQVPNHVERPPNTTQYIIIGSYDWDGSKLATHSKRGNVILCNRSTGDVIYQWDSFNSMICSEVPRISNLFDVDGKELDANQSSLPCG